MQYRSYSYWSIVLGAKACRLSAFDEHGGEHFAIVPQDSGGPKNRQRRNDALDAIELHIRAGREPGEVSID